MTPMPYLNTTTSSFGHTIHDVRAAYPETSIPEGASFGDFAWYTPAEPQAHDPRTHVAVEIAPVNGVQQWRIDPAPVEHIRAVAKAEREAAVAAIKITTAAGNTFDGDETSQGRMARAIVALQGTGAPSVTWVLADNTVIEASAAELTEALALAGAAQAALWVIPQ